MLGLETRLDGLFDLSVHLFDVISKNGFCLYELKIFSLLE